MFIKRSPFLFLASVLLSFGAVAAIWTSDARAENIQLEDRFAPGQTLEPYVNFWRLIFAKYNKDHLVFHHRSHPGIIYSVLDFSEYNQKYSGRELTRIIAKETKAEEDRIRAMLDSLSKSNTPKTVLERRVANLFTTYGGWRGLSYRDAMSEKKIRSQSGILERFRDGVRRSGRYLYFIEKVFADAGLPPELSRLPLVESSFDYNAYSSVGAAGIWQFMRSTGKKYMRIDASIDERRDPIISTRAAVQYLSHAYNVLGTWPLAITSYNHGITGVLRAVKSAGTKDFATILSTYDGDSFGFASQNFYAEFLAALQIQQNWQNYYPDLVVEEPWYFDEVKLGRSMAFRDLAALSNTTLEEFEQLNPALLQPIKSGRVKVPAGFTVKVHRGHGPKLASTIGASAVVSEASLSASRTKAAPIKAKSVVKKEPSVSKEKPTKTYTIESGDSLWRVSKKVGIPFSTLKKLNPGLPGKLLPGTKVRIE